MAKIDLVKLRKTFGAYVAVEGLDLQINDGEFLIMLGPSGCGKTTTLNMIAGLEKATSGNIMFDNTDVTDTPPHERNVAMVFQSSLLYPHISVRRNIETSLRHSNVSDSERKRRIADAARMLEIEPFMDKLPGQLSGGQRQRVATAKAIVREPSVFLLDEPLSALDAALRLALRAELVNLQKRLGTTTVFVTHDQVEAMTMGDRIAVMNGGRLEQIGTPDEIYNAPATVFVAGFLGSPPMNLLEGEVSGGFFRRGQLAVPVSSARGKVTLGVRPQDVAVVEPGTAGALPVTVFAVEHLGRESVLIADDEHGGKIRALVAPGWHARVGEQLAIVPEPARCLLFGADGNRILESLARAA